MNDSISIEKISPKLDTDVWTAISDLCCRTGNGGDPIDRERWELFGRIWIEPYRKLLPDWCYVALVDRRVIGYLTGCPDTAWFARRCFVRCRLPLLLQIAFGRYRSDPYGKRFARQELRWEKSPERSFSAAIRRRLQFEFPAHLHMNVDAEFRRSGVGARLIERFVNDLRQRQVSGVHLFCAAPPLPFYHHMGFDELAVISVRGAPVYALGLRL